jgi:hypothetical protein
MRGVDRAEQVHLEHARPVGRLEVPKRKTKLPGTDASTEDHMIHLLKTGREGLHGLKVGHIARGDEIGIRLTVKATHVAALSTKAFSDGSSDAASGSDDGDSLILKMQVHRLGRYHAT